ncbi:HAMP domain-containing sensor histidine kinase [Flavobacterium branchiophilum]|uniref:sensor histidine kinase n=1 Tax=Flavobacterium branchiophilum TaxID=55197 RepID=UPI0002F196C5|nr:HAMP domain-containing sensor histidine kinase [Flavobacterium branchiophilum]
MERYNTYNRIKNSLSFPKKEITRWGLILASFVVISLILWNTFSFFQIFKIEERIKMEHWAEAQKSLINANENTDIELLLKIIQDARIPIMVTEKDSIINTTNIDENIVKNKEESKAYLQKLKNQNEPIVMVYGPGKSQKLYYGNSDLLNKLKYYPISLLLIILLFILLIYNYYRSHKVASQNKLWAGMAKETAHQIGTPLSSLMGWIEIMKADEIEPTLVVEIEKDINRLLMITDRFSKIGSEPVLEDLDIIFETQQSFEYLQSRFSKQISFHFQAPSNPIYIKINPILHSWTIENLVKNAIDAMKGKGKISLKIEYDSVYVRILISDTGKGIFKKDFNKIFEPGFTTKKRGWGLGLSLTKRIVEAYHKGSIKVMQSEIDKGTTFQISYKTH